MIFAWQILIYKQNSALGKGFIRESLHNNIVPRFVKIKDQFIDSKDKIKAGEGFLRGH